MADTAKTRMETLARDQRTMARKVGEMEQKVSVCVSRFAQKHAQRAACSVQTH